MLPHFTNSHPREDKERNITKEDEVFWSNMRINNDEEFSGNSLAAKINNLLNFVDKLNCLS